jgi:uncharacterized membrane protein
VSLTPHLRALAGAVSSALATILIRQGLRHGNFYVGFWINVVVGVVGLWGAVLLLEPANAYRAAAIPLFMLSGIIGTAGGRLLRFVSIEKDGEGDVKPSLQRSGLRCRIGHWTYLTAASR